MSAPYVSNGNDDDNGNKKKRQTHWPASTGMTITGTLTVVLLNDVEEFDCEY